MYLQCNNELLKLWIGWEEGELQENFKKDGQMMRESRNDRKI